MSSAFILFGILAAFACLAAFLWGVVEERSKPLWLVAAAVAMVVGIVGFLITK